MPLKLCLGASNEWPSPDTGKELANGEVIMVAYDYKEEKSIGVPQEWREKFIEFEDLKV